MISMIQAVWELGGVLDQVSALLDKLKALLRAGGQSWKVMYPTCAAQWWGSTTVQLRILHYTV